MNANIILTFVAGGLLGAISYWGYSQRATKKGTKSLKGKLLRIILNVPNCRVISVCNSYRRFLMEYESELEDIISSIHFVSTEHRVEVRQDEYFTLDAHLRLLKIYFQELVVKVKQENLQTTLNNYGNKR